MENEEKAATGIPSEDEDTGNSEDTEDTDKTDEDEGLDEEK